MQTPLVSRVREVAGIGRALVSPGGVLWFALCAPPALAQGNGAMMGRALFDSVIVRAGNIVPGGSEGTPSRRDVLKALCEPASRDSNVGVVLGYVRTPDGGPAADTKVRIAWNETRKDMSTEQLTQHQVGAEVETDQRGVYQACGLPTATRLIVVGGSVAGAQSGIVRSEIPRGGLLVLDLTLNATKMIAASDRAPVMRRALSGQVRARAGGPVEAARIFVPGVNLAAISDSMGNFRVNNVPLGSYRVEISALGYSQISQPVEVDVGGGWMTATLDLIAVALDSVRTVAAVTPVRTGDRDRYVAFEARRKRGAGTFLTEDDIKALHARTAIDIIRKVPSVKVERDISKGGEDFYVTSARGKSDWNAAAKNYQTCKLDIFIDGTKSDPGAIVTLAADEIHGMEVHSLTTVPAQYLSGQCGAVFFWTK